MTILSIALPNGDCGNAFCIRWRERLVLATCDHLFLSIGVATTATISFGDGRTTVTNSCELRRHATADVALVLPPDDFELGLIPFFCARNVSDQISDSTPVIVAGFEPSAKSLTLNAGYSRAQKQGEKTYWHSPTGYHTYTGVLVGNSLAGIPGLSGSPIRTVAEDGVVAVYSCSGDSRMLTDGFHSGHLDEIS